MGGKWAAVEGNWRPVGAGGAGWRGLDGSRMSVGCEWRAVGGRMRGAWSAVL